MCWEGEVGWHRLLVSSSFGGRLGNRSVDNFNLIKFLISSEAMLKSLSDNFSKLGLRKSSTDQTSESGEVGWLQWTRSRLFRLRKLFVFSVLLWRRAPWRREFHKWPWLYNRLEESRSESILMRLTLDEQKSQVTLYSTYLGLIESSLSLLHLTD